MHCCLRFLCAVPLTLIAPKRRKRQGVTEARPPAPVTTSTDAVSPMGEIKSVKVSFSTERRMRLRWELDAAIKLINFLWVICQMPRTTHFLFACDSGEGTRWRARGVHEGTWRACPCPGPIALILPFHLSTFDGIFSNLSFDLSVLPNNFSVMP